MHEVVSIWTLSVVVVVAVVVVVVAVNVNVNVNLAEMFRRSKQRGPPD